MANFCAIILAGGIGTRASTKNPKQYKLLNGKMLLEYSLRTFIESQIFSKIIVVLEPQYQTLCNEYINYIEYAENGNNRQESTYNGLKFLEKFAVDYVYIHDGARPFVSTQKLYELKENVHKKQGAILALPMQNTIKQSDDCGYIKNTINRKNLYAAQTPQVFPYDAIYDAHKKFKNHNCTDDSQLAELIGLDVKIIEGEAKNLKITWAIDFLIAEQIIKTGDI